MGVGPFHLIQSWPVCVVFVVEWYWNGFFSRLLRFSPAIVILAVLHAYSYVIDALQQLAASLNNTL